MSLSLKVARGRNGRASNGRGDPGIFGTIGSVLGKVASVAKNIPGPIGMVGSAISRISGGGTSTARPAVSTSGMTLQGTSMPGTGFPQAPTPGLVGTLQRFVPGGASGYQDVPAIGSPSGYKVNGTDYFLKDGTFIPKGSRWVRIRKRNPLNPKAASKAIGRLESLKKATTRFNRITIKKKCCK